MLFYRVCHRDVVDRATKLHAGPYCGMISSDPLHRMAWAHTDDEHPSVRFDVDFPDESCDQYGDTEGDGYHDCFTNGRCMVSVYDTVCGFTSVAMLEAWFYGHRAMLRREGFVMRVWDVQPEDVFEGDQQAAVRHDVLRDLTPRVLRIP